MIIFLLLNTFCMFYIISANRFFCADILKLISLFFYVVIDGYQLVPSANRDCDFTILFVLMLLFPFILIYSFSEQDIFTIIVFAEWVYKYKTVTTQIDRNLAINAYWGPLHQDIYLDKNKYIMKQSKETCCICLDSNEEKFIKLPCGHELHHDCFIYYLRQYYSQCPILCPLCRQSVYDHHQQSVEDSNSFILY